MALDAVHGPPSFHRVGGGVPVVLVGPVGNGVGIQCQGHWKPTPHPIYILVPFFVRFSVVGWVRFFGLRPLGLRWLAIRGILRLLRLAWLRMT